MNGESFLVAEFVSNGVPQETVRLVLMLPIIATAIAFIRQIVGMKAFGIYTPLIVTLAFLAMSEQISDVKYGVVIFISVIIIGMITRFILKKFRLLYLPRVAITLSVVSFFILLFLIFGGSQQRTGLASVSIFPLLIMIAIVEKFVAAQIEKGTKKAIVLAFETLLLSLGGFFLANWSFLGLLVTAYPWAVLFTIPFNVFLGKWPGLRISELWRFREVIKKM